MVWLVEYWTGTQKMRAHKCDVLDGYWDVSGVSGTMKRNYAIEWGNFMQMRFVASKFGYDEVHPRSTESKTDPGKWMAQEHVTKWTSNNNGSEQNIDLYPGRNKSPELHTKRPNTSEANKFSSNDLFLKYGMRALGQSSARPVRGLHVYVGAKGILTTTVLSGATVCWSASLRWTQVWIAAEPPAWCAPVKVVDLTEARTEVW